MLERVGRLAWRPQPFDAQQHGDLRDNDQRKKEDDDATHELEGRCYPAQERSSPTVVVGSEAWVFRDAAHSRAAGAL